jgi:hypothetical protein
VTEQPPDHEQIETVYRVAREVTARLPDVTESREARRLLQVAEKLAYIAREKAKPEQAAVGAD